MAHDEYKDLLVAQALTALDESDQQTLAEHLENCAECRSELNQWEQTASLLSLDAKPLEPSPELRGRILNSLSVSASNRASDGTNVVQLPVAKPSSSWAAWGAIAAAVMFVALAIGLAVLWQQNRATKDQLARLNEELQQTNRQLADERAVTTLLTDPNARRAALVGTSLAPAAQATLAYDRDGRAILLAKDLPPAPAGKAYQLWFIAGGTPLPGKVFRPTPQGGGTLLDQIPQNALNAIFAVTLEPESGVQKPTGEIYLKSGS